MLGMRDISHEELYAFIRAGGRHVSLLQVAASNLPVPAEGLAELEPDAYDACCERAGDYRMWRLSNETRDLNDGIEAVRNLLLVRPLIDSAEWDFYREGRVLNQGIFCAQCFLQIL